MLNSSTVSRSLVVFIFGTTLAACEEVPPPKPRSTASTEVTAPIKAPLPPPPAAPTLAPEATPATAVVVKEDPTVEDDEIAEPKGALARARQALAAGDAQGALKLATIAVANAPEHSAAWNTLGRVLLQVGKRKQAIGAFEKAVELNPGNSYAHNNLGLALIYDKRFDEAVDALEDAVELEPVEGYMWNNLGMAYEHLDRLDEARDAYDKAIEMDSDLARKSLARLKGVKSVIQTAKADTGTSVQ